MSAKITGKVALVTGSAGGIGLSLVKNLLQNKIKGITIADINTRKGKEVVAELEQEYGPNRVIFIETDVTSKQSFENAFKRTIEKFQHIDILINNAGVFDEVNWEREIAVNLNGTINGSLLGFEEYLQKFRSGKEGIIVNIASIAGVEVIPFVPIYTASKFGVIGLSKCLGNEIHYKRTGVRVLVICPGATRTNMFLTCAKFTLTWIHGNLLQEAFPFDCSQEPTVISNSLPRIIEEGENGSIWVVENGKTYEVQLVDRKTFEPK